MKARRVDTDVLAVLSASSTAAGLLRLPNQLERDLYLRVDKVLRALGAKWNRALKGHLFASDDAETLVDNVILSGEVTLPEDFGFFPTPSALASDLVARAGVRPGMRALEPSAGDGAIVRELLAAGAEVDAVELLPRNVEKLRVLIGPRANQGDFIDVQPTLGLYDRVVMNPPFAKRTDIRHVMHAYAFLKPGGGRLVSVMSAGVAFRTDSMGAGFRRWVEDLGGSIESLPPGSFKASGTDVNTVVVKLDA